MLKKVVALISAVLSVLFANTPLAESFVKNTDISHRYIIIQGADNELYLPLITELYGKNNPENEVLYAMGVCGPMLLTDSPQVIAAQTENAFSMALEYDVPVWFQMDDINNHNYAYCGESYCTAEKWYENPENVEKLEFGEDALPAPYWFNWGTWQRTPAMPCFNSASFLAFVDSQLQNGFLPVLEKWMDLLKAQNKEYLFAGVSVGWETRMPDYTEIPAGTVDQNGVPIPEAERKMTGYRALENLGYTAQSLKAEAQKMHISENRLRFQILCGVLHDYSAHIAKQIADIGVPNTKIFTHYVIDTSVVSTDKNLHYNAPFVSSAVNEYSTPGFTNNSNVSFKRLATLKAKIAKAEPTQQHYGIVEGYAAGLNNSKKETLRYFNRLFSSGAIVVAVYGISDPEGSFYEVPKTADAPFTMAIRQLIQN